MTTDAIGCGFAKYRKDAGVERGSFYDLRRTFQTVAGETRDQEAVSFVMGTSLTRTICQPSIANTSQTSDSGPSVSTFAVGFSARLNRRKSSERPRGLDCWLGSRR